MDGGKEEERRIKMKTLFHTSVPAVGACLTRYSPLHLLHNIPSTLIVDVIHHVVMTTTTTTTTTSRVEGDEEFFDLLISHVVTLFPSLLLPRGKRPKVFRLFQRLTEKEEGMYMSLFSSTLPEKLAEVCVQRENNPLIISRKDYALSLGEFLFDAGWFKETASVLRYVLEANNDDLDMNQRLMATEKLLLAESYYNLVAQAATTADELFKIVDQIHTQTQIQRPWMNVNMVNLANTYNAFSIYHYSENRYDKALIWSIEGLRVLEGFSEVDHKCAVTVINVLRQASNCCSVKRELVNARVLITKAVTLTKSVFGGQSVKYADTLVDYGFYLISSDNVRAAVQVYQEAVNIRRNVFGNYNIYTATAVTELAYALYVQEYNTGRFEIARCYAEQGINVASRLLPPHHLLHASSARVLALILEEIAIDTVGSPSEGELLLEAENLHRCCLDLTISLFGEMNVQTAKHYGNLGRLYQTMKKYQDAECMHQKAISIKETLLGKWDYEVSLSVGHLASLYNYDLFLFHKAEKLHLRSIAIGEKLFGKSYSGLEYDYRGLLQVYLTTGREDKYEEYSNVLAHWKLLQDVKSAEAEMDPGCSQMQCPQSLKETLEQFNGLGWARWKESSRVCKTNE